MERKVCRWQGLTLSWGRVPERPGSGRHGLGPGDVVGPGMPGRAVWERFHADVIEIRIRRLIVTTISELTHRTRMGRVALPILVAAALLPASPVAAYPPPGRTAVVSIGSDGAAGDLNATNGDVSANGLFVAFDSRAGNLVPGDANNTSDVFVHDRLSGATDRVSLSSAGVEGNGASTIPSISADGRHVAFESEASNLVPGDTNGQKDIFVHDRQTGLTERVSVATDGTQSDRQSHFARVTADGRYVAFSTGSSLLVPGDTNGVHDIFVRDRETGVTERASVAPDGTEGDALSNVSAISGDGRYVAFDSSASNLVPGDAHDGADVFVKDRDTGAVERVSMATDGSQGNVGGADPSISADGRLVAFISASTNLVPGDTTPAADIFVHDRATGRTRRVSVTSDGTQGNDISFQPMISADGRVVVFASNATNLVPGDTNGFGDIFVHHLATRITERVSVRSDGGQAADNPVGPNGAFLPAIGGGVASFQSYSRNLDGDDNVFPDIFARDLGPPAGPGELAVAAGDGVISATGWARIPGATVSVATDPAGDAGALADVLGTDLTAAEVLHRPEAEDLLVRFEMARIGGVRPPPVDNGHRVPSVPGVPLVMHVLRFQAAGISFEVRALPRAATSEEPSAAPSFTLHRCAPGCSVTAALGGGYGTTDEEILVSVALTLLGAGDGDALSGLRAFTALGEAATGPLEQTDELDEVILPDGRLGVVTLDFGVAPAGAPGASVAFDIPGEVVDGRFATAIEAGDRHGGHDVWARVCLDDSCGMTRVPVVLP